MKLLLIFLAMMMQKAPDGRHLFKANNTLMGYTDSPMAVASSELPPALKAWMEWSGTGEQLTTATDHVDPLLWTQWNQSEPYNNLCPEYAEGKRSVTGCVATATAQVLAYWRYPSRYDWNLMLPNYGALSAQNATAAQCQAVAQLMLDCGQAVKMEYGSSSTASTEDVPVALASGFGYNRGARMAYRRYMNYAEWADLMRAELRAGRPLIYRGSSSGGGHCFVIDGFNEEGFFHVNWGWGGKSDGWYRFTMLTPPSQGAGGSSSSDGFNVGQGMVIGLAPATVLSTPVTYTIHADSLGLYKNVQNGDSAVLYNYANYAACDTISGYLGLGLYQNNVLLKVVYQSTFTRKTDGAWRRTMSNVNISGLTAGETYQLIAIWKDTLHSPAWQMIESINHTPCGRTIYATSSNTFTHSRMSGQGAPVCANLQTSVFVPGTTASITTVWTADSLEWTGRVALALENDSDFQFIAYSGMDLMAGRYDTLTISTLKLSVPAGKYRLLQGYYAGNTIHWLPGNDSVMVESRSVVTKIYPAGNAVLADTILSADNPILKIDWAIRLHSAAMATAVYSGTVGIGIYYAYYDSVTTRLLSLAANVQVVLTKQDTLMLHFEGNVGDYLPAGRYCVMMRHRPTGSSSYTVLSYTGYRYYFTIGNTTTGMDATDTKQADVRKELRDGRVVIIRDGQEYDMLGRRLR